MAVLANPALFQGTCPDHLKASEDMQHLNIGTAQQNIAACWPKRFEFQESDSFVMLAGLVNAALRAWDEDRSGARSAVEIAAAMLRHYTTDTPAEPLATEPPLAPGCLAPWQARKVSAFIDASLGSKIRLQDCARNVQLGINRFSQLFKATYGITACHYIRRRRVEHSQQIMLASNQPLSQVALACGFSDQGHFCRVFRAEVGLNPRRWRQLHLTVPTEE